MRVWASPRGARPSGPGPSGPRVGAALRGLGRLALPAALALALGAFPRTGLAATAAAPTGAAPTSPVQMSVSPGLEGFVRVGAWVPLQVQVTNSGPPLNAQLEVQSAVGAPGGGAGEYTLSVSLPGGSAEQFHLSVPADSAELLVNLASGGRQLAQQTVALQYWQGLAVGLLGVDNQAMAPLLGATLQSYGSQVHLLPLDAATLPDTPETLANLDVLVVDEYSAATLPPSTVQAVESWVERGGLLVLCGGPEGARTLPPWAPWLPLHLAGEASLPSLTGLGTAAGVPWKGGGVEVSRATLAGARVLAQQGGVDLAAILPRDAGSVLYLAFDPALTPVQGWSGLPSLWERLLPLGLPVTDAAVTPSAGTDPALSLLQSLASVAENLPEGALPPVSTFAWIMLAYVLIVGPAVFFALRRGRRGAWAWVAVPAVALAAFAGAWRYTRVAMTGSFTQTLSVVRLTPGSPSAVATTLVGVFLPGGGERALTVSPPAALRVVTPSGSGSAGTTAPVRVDVGDAGHAVLPAEGLWALHALGATTDLSAPGPVDANLTLGSNVLTGTIRNGTGLPLRDVAVVADGRSITVGDIAPGASARVTLNLYGVAPAQRLPFGFGPFNARGPLWGVLSDIYQPGSWGAAGPTARQRRLLTEQGVAQAVAGSDESTPPPALIMAWTAWSPVRVALDGAPGHPAATTLLIESVAPQAAVQGAVSAPDGMYYPTAVLHSGGTPAGATTGVVPESGSNTLVYSLPPGVNVSSLQLVFDAPPSGGWPIDVRIYDWTSGRWVASNVNGAVFTLPASRGAVAPDGTVWIRVAEQAGGGGTALPNAVPTLAFGGEAG